MKAANLKFPKTKPKSGCKNLNKYLENLGLGILSDHILMCANSTFAKCSAWDIGLKSGNYLKFGFQLLKSDYFPDEILLSDLIGKTFSQSKLIACVFV